MAMLRPSLTTQGWQEGIRPFLSQDAADKFNGNGLNVDLIRNSLSVIMVAGLELAGTTLYPSSFKSKAGLGSSVVKFGRLTDDDRTRPNHHNLLNISTFRHNL